MSEPTAQALRENKLVRWACIALSVFQLWAVLFSALDPLLHRVVFLSLSLGVVFLIATTETSYDRMNVPAQLLARFWIIACILAGAYMLSRFGWVRSRWPQVELLPLAGLATGVVFVGAVLDATRRLIGWLLVGVIVLFLVYALVGHLGAGVFYHRLLTFEDVVDQLVFTANGLFSAPIAVAATYVYLFIMFGTALELSGAGDYIFRLASLLTGRSRGGPAKVAIASSALYGTITGSPTSNVVTTGLFTIPMMKRVGFKNEIAGAVEAVASTGGALLPPVMGSAAFLMVELTGISYLTISVAALVPALLFYLGIFAQVHFAAQRLNLTVDAQPEASVRELVRDARHLIPIAALVVLLVTGSTPITAAGIALGLTILTSWMAPESRMGPAEILKLLELGARRSLMVTVACAAAGLVVGAIVSTGLGGKVTSLIFSFAGGSVLLALLFTMVVCILLGMGMPVPSAYILTAVLAAPPLIVMGVPELSAHLFILYFAVLSAITPPVAVAAYAAAGIAEENPGRVALQAVRFGIVAFVVPYFFVFRPALLLEGPFFGIVIAVTSATAGVVMLAAALEGFLRAPLSRIERVIALGAGLSLLFPGLVTDGVGLLLGAAVLWGRRRRGVER